MPGCQRPRRQVGPVSATQSLTLSMTYLYVPVAAGASAEARACETTPRVAHRQGSSRKRQEQQQKGINVSRGLTPAWQTNFFSKSLCMYDVLACRVPLVDAVSNNV